MNTNLVFVLGVLSLGCRSEKTINTYNSAPVALITSHQDGDVVYEGFPVEIRGQVTDSNHSSEFLETAWYYETEEICGWTVPDSGGGTFCDFTPTLGSNTLRLEVRDSQGSGSVSSVIVSIEETNAPTATITAPSTQDVLYTDQKILFEGQISDVEDSVESLMVEWSSDIDGTIQSETTTDSSGNVNTGEYLSIGQHIVQLTVTDSTGKTDSDSISITVGEANSPPDCAILSPETNFVSLFQDEITFEGSVSDPDTNPSTLSVLWSSDKDGVIGTSISTSSGEVVFNIAELSANTHIISMTAEDPFGLSCNDTIVVRVGTPPEVTILSPSSNETFLEGESIVFVVSVSDLEDSPTDVSLNWTLDGQPYTTLSADSSGLAQFTENGLGFGNHTLSILTTDTDGMTDSTQVSFSINGIPTTPSIQILPVNPVTTDELSLSITQQSIDPEGQPISYTYIWSKNGVPQTSSTASTLSDVLTNKNDLWTISVTPSDGLTTGVPATVSVTIQNTAPTIDSLAITSSGAIYNDSILTCSATISDPDETVNPTYEWNLGGQSYTGSTVNLGNYSLSAGDVLSCTATADDGTDSTTLSASETVINRAPVVSSVSISPTLLYSNSTATCMHQSSDPDGDSLTESIDWLINGQTIGSGTSITLTGLTFPSDSLECSVTANDGTSSTVETSTSVSISNSLPSTPGIALSSSNSGNNPAAEQDDLFCTITSSSSDVDGDPITYTFTWNGPNGEVIVNPSISGPVNTLPATTPTTEGLWICTVEASDGTDVSPSASATIYVDSGCPVEGNGTDISCPSTDCLSILDDGHASFGDDGVYWIDPDGNGAYQAYCDMSTDGGGWTMCYTENADMVHLQTDTTYTGGYGQTGYRTDCREVPFTDVLYINHDNGQKAWFYSQSGTPLTIANLGYGASGASANTFFTPGGVAATGWSYQLNVCDQSWMWVGLMMTGYTNCYKQCWNWCGDTSSPYFRADGDNGGSYNGVSFNQNGHTNVGYKTMSVGIR